MASATRPAALVAGAGGRLGSRVAAELAARGYRLALTRRSGDVASHPGSSVHDVDFADPAAIDRVVGEALDAHGSLDAVVWAAGIVQRPRVDPLELDAATLDRQFAINVRAPFLLATAVARHWIGVPAEGPRSVVVATSMAAVVADPELSAYCIAKNEASGLVATLALRLAAEGVLVTEVAPGFLSAEPGTPAPVPTGEAGDLAGVARLVAALAAGDFPAVTGQRIVAAGGAQIPTLSRPPAAS